MILPFIKKYGETMTVCMNRLREELAIPLSTPITYAGRLDPAACGLVLFLTDEDRYKKDDYLHLDKTYTIQVLFGIGSDTGDIFGVVSGSGSPSPDLDLSLIQSVLDQNKGTITEPYPRYSARRVEGKPLWQHASTSSRDTSVLHTCEIYSIDLLSKGSILGSDIKEKVSLLSRELASSDFRHAEILSAWKSIEDTVLFPYIELSVRCSSGTYMRTLSERIGQSLGEKSLALSIERTHLGEYTLEHIEKSSQTSPNI